MTNNSKTLATILIVVIIASALFLVYYFFFRPTNTVPVADGGLFRESTVGVDGGITDFDSLTSQTGRELLFLLDDLRSISFDSEFTTDSSFTNLEDFSRPLEPQTPGRENPFAAVQ